MSDTRIQLGFIGIGLLAVIILIIYMLFAEDASSQEKRLLILDAPACEAVRRLGMNASTIEQGVCTLEARMAFRSEWLTLGGTRLHASHVIVLRDVE